LYINKNECPICLAELSRPWEPREVVGKSKWFKDPQSKKLVRQVEMEAGQIIYCADCCNPILNSNHYWVADIVLAGIYFHEVIKEDHTWRTYVSRMIRRYPPLVHVTIEMWNECIDDMEQDILKKLKVLLAQRPNRLTVSPASKTDMQVAEIAQETMTEIKEADSVEIQEAETTEDAANEIGETVAVLQEKADSHIKEIKAYIVTQNQDSDPATPMPDTDFQFPDFEAQEAPEIVIQIPV
jgi:hypothetical protein